MTRTRSDRVPIPSDESPSEAKPRVPRRRAEKSPPTPPPSDTSDVPLVGPALDLWDQAHERWELDAVASRILRGACESLMLSNKCQAIIDAEGVVVPDRWGRPQKHPAVMIGRDARAHFTLALAKLRLDLE